MPNSLEVPILKCL